VRTGREPLFAIYPVDGLTIADSPLGYIDRGDASKKALFQRLQQHLLSDAVQKRILASGRRVGMVDLAPDSADKAVFNPDWGIDLTRLLAPIRFPQESVIREALDLYQTSFRKPSFTVYCIDVSGSMEGQALEDLKTSMRMLLQEDSARRYLLQASPRDVTIVIPFSSDPKGEMTLEGNDPAKLDALYAEIARLDAGGGTDIYSPVMRAFQLMAKHGGLEQYFPAVILMTDGKSNEGRDFDDLLATRSAVNLHADVPVYAIMFGDAAPEQLQQIAASTSGRVFDGKKDLVKAFRQAKGYN
jgi:Ca-activated chloride channel family protein